MCLLELKWVLEYTNRVPITQVGHLLVVKNDIDLPIFLSNIGDAVCGTPN